MNIVHRAEQPVDLRATRYEREDIEWMKPLTNGLFWVTENPTPSAVEGVDGDRISPNERGVGWSSLVTAAWTGAVTELNLKLCNFLSTDLVVHQTDVVYAACSELHRSRYCRRVAKMIRECVEAYELEKFVDEVGKPVFKIDYDFVSRATKTGWYFRLRLEFNKG
jgi:hypothetical protein